MFTRHFAMSFFGLSRAAVFPFCPSRGYSPVIACLPENAVNGILRASFPIASLIHLFVKSLLKRPFCRFKRHTCLSPRFHMARCPDLPWAWGGRLASGPFGIKGFGYFFHINILILIVFNVKILLKKRQLKSSDSCQKLSETMLMHVTTTNHSI